MATRTEVQKGLADLQRQIGDLTKRREKLSADRESLQSAVDKGRKQQGADLLAGKDTGAASDALARDVARLDALSEAIAQADEQLRDLNRQLSDHQAGLLVFEVNDAADGVVALAARGVDQLREFVATVDALQVKHTDFVRLADRQIVRDEYRDARSVDKLFQIDTVRAILRDIELQHPKIYAGVASKK